MSAERVKELESERDRLAALAAELVSALDGALPFMTEFTHEHEEATAALQHAKRELDQGEQEER